MSFAINTFMESVFRHPTRQDVLKNSSETTKLASPSNGKTPPPIFNSNKFTMKDLKAP